MTRLATRLQLTAACLAVSVCGAAPDSHPASVPQPGQARAAVASLPAGTHLQITGTTFRTSDGRPFQWRGITAFRLLDFIADNDSAQAERFLAWARQQKLTVVRVLAMGGGFMNLSPADGRRALPRLLAMAQAHGVYVEVVALAGTKEMPVSTDEQVAAIGAILYEHGNGLLEIANEPAHPSQAPEVGRVDVLLAAVRRVPAGVPVALGSLEADEGFGRGAYATWHSPRDNKLDGWGHVLAVARGAELIARLRKPLISDEPIGAGGAYEAGRRDDSAARFRAAALLTRLAGLGATFHYNAGLQTTIPEGRELECFNAWNEAWTLLPPGIEDQGTFAVAGSEGAVVRNFDRTAAFAVFERVAGDRGWVLAVGPGDPAPSLATGWSVSGSQVFAGARLLTVTRER